MDIPILIQPVAGKGFVATAPAFGWSAEGATADEALQRIRKQLADATTHGQVAIIAVPNGTGRVTTQAIVNPPKPGENPWLHLAGTLPDDELTARFQQAVEEYRRQTDDDPIVY